MPKPILDTQSFRSLICRNWTSFIDKNVLLAYLLREVKNATLPLSETKLTPIQGIKISISNIELHSTSYLIWVEFQIPSENNSIKSGTMETLINSNGELISNNIIGQKFQIY